jgi:hypothetical protein
MAAIDHPLQRLVSMFIGDFAAGLLNSPVREARPLYASGGTLPVTLTGLSLRPEGGLSCGKRGVLCRNQRWKSCLTFSA